MVTVIHEAKTQLSKPHRLGFLVGQIAVPEDFNRMGETEIAALFGSAG